MGNSWLLAGATAGIHVRIAAPEGHQPDEQYVAQARAIGGQTGATAEVMSDPKTAVADADVVVTDTWVSMGKEDQAGARAEPFVPYAVTDALLKGAAEDAIVLHCLPAHRGREIAADVIDGPRSVVWDEAENRLHAQKALLTWLLDNQTTNRGGQR
jgi:ornithine carbamoyltransferase